MSRLRHTPATARVGTGVSPAITASASNVDGALRRLSATVQTALMRVERNRLKGGRS